MNDTVSAKSLQVVEVLGVTVQASAVAPPFFITVTVSVALLPPAFADADSVTDKFETVVAGGTKFPFVLVPLIETELSALP